MTGPTGTPEDPFLHGANSGIRAAAVQLGVPCITTIQAAEAAVKAMEALREESMEVQSLQDRFEQKKSEVSAFEPVAAGV